jgi:drug/metabolite transporter (DMT)-like permease
VTFGKYLVLAAVAFFAAVGDVLLARGMRDVGRVSLSNWQAAITAVANPWIVVGILLLIGFFGTYLAALSWADLTYVLPATSVSYIVMALLGKYMLGETISFSRWAGIFLITVGVGFVATAESKTNREASDGASIAPSMAAFPEHDRERQ